MSAVAFSERTQSEAFAGFTTIQPTQRTAAKLAGFCYLFTMAVSVFSFYARDGLIVRGDVVATAQGITGAERLFRISIAGDLIMLAGVLVLVVALYVVLKPVNPALALLAASWRLVENAIVAVATLSAFAVLVLLSGADYLRPLTIEQSQALAYTALRLHGAGFQIGFVFLGFGSTVFSCLWFKSRYIPRALAGLGVLGSAVLALGTLTIMAFPRAGAVGMGYMAPLAVYEITLGIWLLVKGIRTPTLAGTGQCPPAH